jgi:hypothetical protein
VTKFKLAGGQCLIVVGTEGGPVIRRETRQQIHLCIETASNHQYDLLEEHNRTSSLEVADRFLKALAAIETELIDAVRQ